MTEELSTFTLERLRHYAAVMIDENDLASDLQGSMIEWTARRMVESFATQLCGVITVWGCRTHTERVTYPEDWWQAFKQRWLPRWALRRWPVRQRTIEMDAYAWVPGFLPGVGKNEWRAYVHKREIK